MRIRRILSLHLTSSGLFVLATLLPTIAYTITFFNSGATVSVKLIEFLSWTLLTCHVLPEIIIDLNTFPKAKRKLPHVRYGIGPCTNFLQSTLFAAACIFQCIFFASTWSDELYEQQSEQDIDALNVLNLIAGHVWLCSGLVAFCSIGTAIPFLRRPSNEGAGFWEKVANDVYLGSTVLLCMASYLMPFSRTAARVIQIVVRFIWCFLGGFYFANDIVEKYLYMCSTMEDGRKSRQKNLLTPDEEVGAVPIS